MNHNFQQLRNNAYRADGGNGGNMDDLTSRVEQLEKDTHQIRIDVAILTERSQNFVTKSELADLKVEIHQGFSEIHKNFSEIHKNISEMHKQIASQTRWILGSLVAIAGIMVTISKLPF